MCGICGKIDLTGKPVPLTLLRGMTGSFAYRGPDDEGFFLTVLHLYEEEGVACLMRLNGMFGFALWDARLQRLWLEPYERPAGHLVGVVEPDCL